MIVARNRLTATATLLVPFALTDLDSALTAKDFEQAKGYVMNAQAQLRQLVELFADATAEAAEDGSA